MYSSAIESALGASVTGQGERVIILANGLGTSQNAWRHVVPALERDHRVVRFDYIGTPDADPAAFQPARYETLHGHADDAIALLDALGVSDATWVGHSVSGMIGLLVARTAPELVGRLALVSASPRYMDDKGYRGGFSRAAVESLLESATGDFHAWVAGFSPLVVGRPDCPDVVEEFASHLLRMRPDIAVHTLRSIFLSDHRDILAHVRQPVVVIQPREDVAVPMEVGQYMARMLPRAVLRELDSHGHLPHLTAPVELVAVLRESLDAWSRSPARAERELATCSTG